jgi:hypothetical protein
MTVTTPFDDPAVSVDHAHGVFLASPVDASEVTSHDSSLQPLMLTAAGGEVPWRLLIDGAQVARLPVAALGTSTDRREALVSCWPSARASELGALPTAAGTTEDDQ